MSPATPPLLLQPQSCAELYWDLLSRSKASLVPSFSGIWLPLENSRPAKSSFSLGQSLKGSCQLCSPNCSPETGACAWEGRKEISARLFQHNVGNSSPPVPLSQKSLAGLSCVG